MSGRWFGVPLEGWKKLAERCKAREKAAPILYVTLYARLLTAYWENQTRQDDTGKVWFAVDDRMLSKEANLAKKTIEPAIKKLVDLELILAKRVPKSCSEYHLKLDTPSTQIPKKLGTSGTTPGDHYRKDRNNRSNDDFISTKY